MRTIVLIAALALVACGSADTTVIAGQWSVSYNPDACVEGDVTVDFSVTADLEIEWLGLPNGSSGEITIMDLGDEGYSISTRNGDWGGSNVILVIGPNPRATAQWIGGSAMGFCVSSMTDADVVKVSDG